MTTPTTNIGLILGPGTLAYNGRRNLFTPYNLFDNRAANVEILGTGMPGRPVLRRQINALMQALMQAPPGPVLVFGLLNARWRQHELGAGGVPTGWYKQPKGLGVNTHELHTLLEIISSSSRAAGRRVDAFLLTAQGLNGRHQHLHNYARKMPAGSTLVLAKTTIDAGHALPTFLPLLQDLTPDNPFLAPTALNILATYLLSNQLGATMPQLAISGSRPMHLRHMWNLMVERGPMSRSVINILSDARSAFKTLSPASNILSAISLFNMGAKPAAHALHAYICPLVDLLNRQANQPQPLNLQPAIAAQAIAPQPQPAPMPSPQPAPSHSVSSPAAAGPSRQSSTGRHNRPSARELAGAPQNLRKIILANPQMAKRLLRR